MEILNGIEDRAAPYELGEPGKQQVRFMAQIVLEWPARPPLERLEPPVRSGPVSDVSASILTIVQGRGRIPTEGEPPAWGSGFT